MHVHYIAYTIRLNMSVIIILISSGLEISILSFTVLFILYEMLFLTRVFISIKHLQSTTWFPREQEPVGRNVFRGLGG